MQDHSPPEMFNWTVGKNHYEVLGVGNTAGAAEIKSAYRALMQKHHPDVSDDPQAHEISVSLNEAYRVLMDGTERRAYDLRLLNGVAEGKGAKSRWRARDGMAYSAREYLLDVSQRYASGATVQKMFYAVDIDDMEMLEEALSHGVNVDEVDRYDLTPFMRATLNGKHQTMRLLVEMGADVNRKSIYQETALVSVIVNGAAHAVETARVLLMELGANLDEKDDTDSTALHYAAQQGEEALVEMLLAKGATVDVVNQFGGETALHRASIAGHHKVCQTLIAYGANVERRDGAGRTPFLAAMAFTSKLRVLNALADAGADKFATDYSGRNALHLAAMHGNGRTLTRAVSLGLDIDAKDKVGRTALEIVFEMNFIKGPKAVNVVKRLLNLGANPNRLGANGETLLMKAVREGEHSFVSSLLDSGADIDARDAYGDMPLHIAVKNATARTIKALIEAGADVDAEGAYGLRPIHLVAQLKKVSGVIEALDGCDIEARVNTANGNFTPLMIAASNGNTKALNKLIKKGADVNAKDELGYTALAFAARWPRHRMLESLVLAGADVNVSDHIGWTPLHWAVRVESLRSVILLLNAGANPNVKTDDGLAPLHLAVEGQMYEIVTNLLDRGADTEITDMNGATPLHWAASSEAEYDFVYELLVNAGADESITDSNGMTPPDRRLASRHYFRYAGIP